LDIINNGQSFISSVDISPKNSETKEKVIKFLDTANGKKIIKNMVSLFFQFLIFE